MNALKRTVIACSMLEDEIQALYEKLNCNWPVIWIERGYHNTPDKLREELQRIILEHQDQDDLLLSFGLCGNGSAGIYSPNTRLILPRFDDCLNMLLCPSNRPCRGLTQAGTIYMTKGWSLDESGILQQYEKNLELYGKEDCDAIMEMMYAHYDSITMIDTGCYDMEKLRPYACRACDLLNLKLHTTLGNLTILEQLFTGNWNENFIVALPGEKITESLFEFPSDF